MYLSTPIVSVDSSGGTPAPATLPFPPSWVRGWAHMVRFAARLTTSGTVEWLPAGSTTHTTSIDPGFLGSILDSSLGDIVSAAVAGSGAVMDGSPSASAYVALLAATSDGVNLTPAGGFSPSSLVTGHPYFPIIDVPAGSTWLQAVVTIGATPPTITDGNGFTWTQLVQQQFGGGYLTVWTAPITRNTASSGERVSLSEACDSGIGFALAGQAP